MTEHGKRDEIAFRGEQLGAAKTRAEAIGREQRAAFEDITRMVEAWAGDGINIDPSQISFADEVDQAAWRCFCIPSSLRGPLDAPVMDHEDTLVLKAVQ
jgi:hypothetical protein